MSTKNSADSMQDDYFRSLSEFDNHEMVVAVNDDASGLQAFIGIHSTALGPALGGTRFQAYDNDQEALQDALRLSRAMTYKCALAGLPYGGGKGVIIDSGTGDRTAKLAAYARAVEDLHGQFKTGTDVGISDEDVVHMGQFTSHMLGLTPGDRGNLTTADCAALGVFYSIKATHKKLDGTDDCKGLKVAIKGIGKLGGELARLLREAGAEVVVSDIHKEQVDKLTNSVEGIRVVDNQDIHKQQVDIYAPCALGNEFTDEVMAELQCRAIVGGANNQLPHPETGNRLFEQGIIYVPDYIANAGGLIYVADELEAGGFNKQRVRERIANIQHTVTDILDRTEQQHRPTSEIADQIARERIQAKQ